MFVDAPGLLGRLIQGNLETATGVLGVEITLGRGFKIGDGAHDFIMLGAHFSGLRILEGDHLSETVFALEGPNGVVGPFSTGALFQDQELSPKIVLGEIVENLGAEFGEEFDLLRRSELLG